MTDRLKPMSETWHDRQRRHRHNGFSGSARMMEMQLQAMLDSDSTSKKTKQIAAQMKLFISSLKESLKTRIDP